MGTSARVAEPHAQDRVEPRRLAEEQAALRRVATLVASGAPSAEVFLAVAQEDVVVSEQDPCLARSHAADYGVL